MKKTFFAALSLLVALINFYNPQSQNTLTYKIVDTGQKICYDTLIPIPFPQPGTNYYGQDAQFNGYQPAYQDNGDSAVSDLITGLMWQKNLADQKMIFDDALAGERLIDAQCWSSKEYVGTTMMGDATAFGVNFADGRIKGYPTGLFILPTYSYARN